jgi:hypothetical protein
VPERIRKVRESYINYIADNHAFHAESSVSESLDGLLMDYSIIAPPVRPAIGRKAIGD